MANYGLTRASLVRQEASPQVQADAILTHAKLLGLGDVAVLHEKLGTSGHSTLFANRKQGKWILENLVEGDVLIVAKMDRLGRITSDILNTIETLSNRGIRICIINFLGGQSLDISTSVGRLIVTMFAGVAQFERDTMAERIAESMQWHKKVGRAYTKPQFGFKIQEGAPLPGCKKKIKRFVPINPTTIHEIVTRVDAGERFCHIANDFWDHKRTCKTWSRKDNKFVERPWAPMVYKDGKPHQIDARRIKSAYLFAKRLEKTEATLAAMQDDHELQELAAS